MIKKIGIVAIVLIVLIISYNLVVQIFDAYRAGERLSQAAEELYKLDIKNKELKKKLSEIKSYEFIEKQARDKLGLAKKGETIVVIPDEKIKQVLGTNQTPQESRLPNWLGWLKVFWH